MLTKDDDRARLARLEGQDAWLHTAWKLAMVAGDVDEAQRVWNRCTDDETVGLRHEEPALHLAIQGRHSEMLQWLLAKGLDVELNENHGEPPLTLATERDWLDGIRLLIAAGARLDSEHCGSTPLALAQSHAAITCLLDAGADAAQLSSEGRRILVGLPPDADSGALDKVTAEQFMRSHSRRFGTCNPEPIHDAFWSAMVRSGVDAYRATSHFCRPGSAAHGPVWCARRFGQSLTFLPGGRIVQIGGEHEDDYDPDFCIYNDVIVHDPNGTFQIYAYPESVFEPTDFHTATLCGDAIVIIGSLGYGGQRHYGQTPVYRIDTRRWRIERMDTRGEGPGWIHRHRASLVAPGSIRVEGGVILTKADGRQEKPITNDRVFRLDLDRWRWHIDDR